MLTELEVEILEMRETCRDYLSARVITLGDFKSLMNDLTGMIRRAEYHSHEFRRLLSQQKTMAQRLKLAAERKGWER